MNRPWVTSRAYEAAIQRLVAIRTDLGISQRSLAERLGKHRSFVTKIESRERRLDLVEFIAIARAFGMAPTDLMAMIDAEMPDKLDF